MFYTCNFSLNWLILLNFQKLFIDNVLWVRDVQDSWLAKFIVKRFVFKTLSIGYGLSVY